MAKLQKKTANDCEPAMLASPMAGSPRVTRSDVAIAVSVRQQTPSEERQFEAALQLFLTELVRQQLGRQGKQP